MDFLRSVAGKLVTGGIALAVIAGGIGWYETSSADRSAIVSAVGRVLGWVLAMLAVPWLIGPVLGRVARADSNAASGALIVGLTAIESLALAALFHFSIAHAVALFVAATLLAGVYNLLACDWIAERWS